MIKTDAKDLREKNLVLEEYRNLGAKGKWVLKEIFS